MAQPISCFPLPSGHLVCFQIQTRRGPAVGTIAPYNEGIYTRWEMKGERTLFGEKMRKKIYQGGKREERGAALHFSAGEAVAELKERIHHHPIVEEEEEDERRRRKKKLAFAHLSTSSPPSKTFDWTRHNCLFLFYFHRLPLVAVCVGYVDRHRMCVCIYFTHFFIALPVINEVISRPVIFVTPFFLVFFFVSSTCFSLIFNGPERFGWVSVFVCFRESFEISRNKRRNKATIPRLRYLYMHFAACTPFSAVVKDLFI